MDTEPATTAATDDGRTTTGASGSSTTSGVTETTGQRGTDTDDEQDTDPYSTPYNFRLDEITAYARVDRVAMPGTSMLFVLDPEDKDDFNDGAPDDDRVRWGSTFLSSVIIWHFGAAAVGSQEAGMGLVDDLQTHFDDPLQPCITKQGPIDPDENGSCADVNLAANGSSLRRVLPDVARVDTSMEAGFPNGRALDDPVMDMMLALMLLDLGDDPFDSERADDQLVTTFVGVLNPEANEVAFDGTFPYLADAHGG